MFHKVNYNINEEINGRDYSNSILLIIYYFIKIKYLSELTREKNQQKALVTVQYLGIPFETGYNIEDPILLPR